MKNVLSFLTLLVTFLISGMLPTVGKTNPREKHGLQSQFSGQLFAYDIFSRSGNSKEINSDLDSLRRLTIVPTDTELAALLPRSLLKTALASERITYSSISALYDSDIQVAAEVTNNLETELAIVNAASLLTGAGGITSRAISLGASRATVIYLTETGITMGAATAIVSIGNESINQAVESGSMTENQATITRLGIQAASLYLTVRAVKTPVPNSPAAANRAVTSSSGGAGLVYDIDFAAINATRARTVAGNGGVLSGPQNARQTIATVMDTGGDLFSSRNLGGLGPLHAEPTVLSQLPASSQPWIIGTSNNFCGGHCYPMLQEMNAAFLRHSPRATGYKTAVFPRPPDPTR